MWKNCFPGVEIDTDYIQSELDRRKPGQSKITTPRKEKDLVEVLSGIFEGKSTGAPISLQIKNKDQRSSDYKHISESFRPSHADYTYFKKYGNRDHKIYKTNATIDDLDVNEELYLTDTFLYFRCQKRYQVLL